MSPAAPDDPAISSSNEPAQSRLDRLIGWVAIAGGLGAMGVALLVVISVIGRWIFGKPIEGDFEFVKMFTAVAVFSFLPYTQVQRGNIAVDSFTTRASPRVQRSLDAVWDLVYAAVAALMAHGLFTGAQEAFRNKETTMQLQLVVWPAIALCAVLAALLIISCLVSALRLARGQS
ncbi:DctM TRAP-type C4-dicarboxylate transport system, small permease component [Rhabdaerophilaceae bacterium]